MNSADINQQIQHLLRPRLIICLAGAYPDGKEHCLEAGIAREVIRISKTNAAVVHLPVDIKKAPRTCLPIDELSESFLGRAVPLLNTSRATDAAQARQMIDFGLTVFDGPFGDFFGHPPLIKLEILNNELQVVDSETLRCLRGLPGDVRRRTLPILSPCANSVASASDLGCPAIRLLSGRIGQRTGVVDTGAVKAAIESVESVPVTLEGGIDTRADVQLSAQLGAAGVLINSAFLLAPDPLARAAEFRRAADKSWGSRMLSL